eukprot:78017-Rhodomonas_salina.7
MVMAATRQHHHRTSHGSRRGGSLRLADLCGDVGRLSQDAHPVAVDQLDLGLDGELLQRDRPFRLDRHGQHRRARAHREGVGELCHAWHSGRAGVSFRQARSGRGHLSAGAGLVGARGMCTR